jgi:hypothetical protein
MSDVMFGPKHCRKCSKNHYPGPCPEPPPYVMPRIVSPHRHHGLHPWAQPGDRPDRVWILRFDDTDQRDQIWQGGDAEERALAAYRLYAPTWNCTLLASVAADLLNPAKSSAGVRTTSPQDQSAHDEPITDPQTLREIRGEA